MLTVKGTSPAGAKLVQVAMTSATHMHRLCSDTMQCCSLGKCALKSTAILNRLKSCIQDALQNMQARHKTATANPVSKQPCWDKLYSASCSEVSKQMSVWYVLQSQPTLHCVNHPISCADRTRQWRCTKHLSTILIAEVCTFGTHNVRVVCIVPGFSRSAVPGIHAHPCFPVDCAVIVFQERCLLASSYER